MSQTATGNPHSRADWIYNDEGVLVYENFMADWRDFVGLVGAAKASRYMKEARAEWPPRVMSLDLTPKCNLKCPMCRYHGDDEAEALYDINSPEVDQIVQFLEQVGAAETIAFGIMAEPFLSKAIWDALERLRPLCKNFSFSTNALPLTEKTIKRLANYEINDIRVSCDAGDAEGYALWRAGGRFDQFLEKLGLLVNEFGQKIVPHSVVYEQNQESLLKFPQHLKKAGAHVLEMAGLFETAVSKRNGLRPIKGQQLRDFLLDMLAECDIHGIRFDFGAYQMTAEDAEWLYGKTGGRLGCESHLATIGKGMCRLPWDYLGFAPEGPVSPCCGGGVDGFIPKRNPFSIPGDKLYNFMPILILRAMKLAGYTPSICRENCHKQYDFKVLPERA